MILRRLFVAIFVILCVSCGDTPTSPTSGSNRSPIFSVKSKVEGDCAEFIRNGESFYLKCGGATGGRGFNIASISMATGRVITIGHFDTWDTRGTGKEMDAMIAFLNAQPVGTLLLISVADDAGLNTGSEVDPVIACRFYPFPFTMAGMDMLRSLGAKQIDNICFRSGYALITIKGVGAKAEGVSNTRAGVTISYTLNLR